MKPVLPAFPKRLCLSMVVFIAVCVQLACNFPGSRAPAVSPRLLELTATLASLLVTPDTIETPQPMEKTEQPEAASQPAVTTTPAARRYTLRDEIAREVMSPSTADPSIPPDVLASVPPPGGIGYEGPFCSKNFPSPVIDMAPKTIPVFSLFDGVNACGWQNGEKVTITVFAPDGQQNVEEATFDTVMGWGVAYMISPKMDDLLGQYRVRFEGPSGTLEHAFEVVPPDKPGMEKIGAHQFFLHNFPAGARMRLFAYRQNAGSNLYTLAGWRELQVDSSGELLIEEQYQDDSVALVLLDGDGKEYMGSWGLTLQIAKPAAAACPGAPASRLNPGGSATVSTEQQTPNNLRTSPNPQASVLGLLPPGEKLTILNTQPVCAGGYLWWNVRSNRTDLTGWTAEGSGTTYWLVP